MRRSLALALLVAAGVVASAARAAPTGRSSDDDSTARYAVLLRDPPGAAHALRATAGDRAATAAALRQRHALAKQALLDAAPLRNTVASSWLANALFVDLDPQEAAALSARPEVASVHPVAQVSLPPAPKQAADEAPGDTPEATWGLHRTRALEARQRFGVDGSGVVVGILDSGIDPDHPDLAGKTLAFESFVDDTTEPNDENGHGSHCAGTIAGGAASGRAIGVAPGVKLVVGKIFSKAGLTTEEVILAGMEWIVDPDGVPNSGDEPRLISNSWGGGPGRVVFRPAVQAWRALGILPIFAAGNDGPREETLGTPGSYPEVLAVGATTVEETVAEFSSRGPAFWDGVELIKPDVSAPGRKVTSARVGGGYKVLSGTSMATPHVSGLAALVAQARPDLDAEGLRQLLEATTLDRGPLGRDPDWGTGRIDCVATLAVATDGGALEGEVVDSAGVPVPWASVRLQGVERAVGLDDAGRFRVRLPAGSYQLEVTAFGLEPASLQAAVVADQTAQHTIALASAPTGQVAVLARDPQGRPLPATVEVLGQARPGFQAGADAVVRADLPEGSHTLRVSAYGHQPLVLEDVSVETGATLGLEVEMAKLPPVLLIDDDRGQDFERYYTASLDRLGVGYELVDHDAVEDSLTLHRLQQYEVVLWFTGKDSQHLLKRQEMHMLLRFLQQGGRLFMTGQEVGFVAEDEAFYTQGLRAEYLADGTSFRAVEGDGLAFALTGGDGVDQYYPDVVDAREGAEVWLRYTDGRGAAIRWRANHGASVYLAFGFEGAADPDSRDALMEKALAYLRPTRSDLAQRWSAR